MSPPLKHQKKYFDNIASSYHSKMEINLKSIARIFKITKPYVSGKVLDIGNGGIISYETKNAKKITIADLAPKMLTNPLQFKNGQLVPFRSKKVEVVEANVLKMPFKNGEFDTTIMITTAHHLSVESKSSTKNNIQTAIREISRVTKTGGTVIIHECFYNPVLKVLQEIFFEPAYFFFNLFGKPLPYFMSRTQLSRYLNDASLSIIKIANVPTVEKVYLPIFPSLSPPGQLWDKILRSDTFTCKKI